MEMNSESKVSKASKRDLAAEVLQAFAPFATIEAPGLEAALRASARYLVVTRGARLIILDRTALLCGIAEIGERPDLLPFPNAATWLSDLGLRKFILPRQPLSSQNYDGLDGLRFALSPLVRSTVIELASEFSMRTIERVKFSLRHLAVALIVSAKPKMLPEIFTLLNPLIEKIIENREPSESTEAWLYIAERYRSTALAATMPPTAAPAPSEALPTLSDVPALVDRLNRAAFAKALAEHLRAVSDPARGAFMVHLHGPWGAGKSTVLKLLDAELKTGSDPWLVIDFNAWQHQRLRPPWWSLVRTLYEHPAARGCAGSWRRWWRLRWWQWRAERGAAIAVVVVTTLFLVTLLNGWGNSLQGITGLLALVGGLIAAQRWLVFGSAKAAESYSQQAVDPHKPMTLLYRYFVRSCAGWTGAPWYFTRQNRPIAIFIDDLDRCERGYVVELMEGIQTLMRDEPVAFVIAADRNWLSSAFEKHYADFAGDIGTPGRPLGHLFLDKFFQLSAGLPVVTAQSRDRFWRMLLEGEGAAPILSDDSRTKLDQAPTIEAKQAIVAALPDAEQPAARAAIVEASYAPEQQKTLEHRLRDFAAMIEPNPRAMKRLVNAVAINRTRAVLEGRDVDLATLARWSILEMRWPRVAAQLIDEPTLLDDDGADEPLGSVRKLSSFRQILGGEDDPGRLNSARLAELFG